MKKTAIRQTLHSTDSYQRHYVEKDRTRRAALLKMAKKEQAVSSRPLVREAMEGTMPVWIVREPNGTETTRYRMSKVFEAHED